MKHQVLTLILLALMVGGPLSATLPTNTSHPQAYSWLWQVLENATGTVVGDDPVVWGPDLGPYLNYDELKTRLQTLESSFPNMVDLYSIGQSCFGRELWMVRLTDESARQDKHSFLLIAQTHGREAITTMNAVYTLEKLLSDFLSGDASETVDFIERRNFYFGAQYKTPPNIVELLQTTEVYILPSLNPDALDIMHINPWQRKSLCEYDDDGDGNATNPLSQIRDVNGDGYIEKSSNGGTLEGGVTDFPGGVDMNRNWGYKFGLGVGSSGVKKDDRYRGPYAFSEPETQALRDWILEHRYDLNNAISLHSGIRAAIAPWGYTSGADSELQEMNDITNYGLVPITGYPNWDSIGGYATDGEWGDWTFGVAGVPAYTLETYGANTLFSTGTGQAGIWDYFNPAGDRIIATSVPVYRATYFMAANPRYNFNGNALPSLVLSSESSWDSTTETALVVWNISDPHVRADDDNVTVTFRLSEDGLTNWTLVRQATNLTDTKSYTQTFVFTGYTNTSWLKITLEDGAGGRRFSLFQLKDLNNDFDPPEETTTTTITTTTTTPEESTTTVEESTTTEQHTSSQTSETNGENSTSTMAGGLISAFAIGVVVFSMARVPRRRR